MEFQVPAAVGESGDGNDLQCVDPRAKLEDINNFNVTYSQLCLDEHREISIGSVHPQEKTRYVDPGLPYSVVDIVNGVLSSRLTISTMGHLSSAYVQMLNLDVGLILPQIGEEVALRLLGHTQAQGCHLLSKIIRHQGAQIIEVECGDESVIFSYDFKLRRRVFGELELIRRRRHLVQGWMMLTSGRLNTRPLYPHLMVMS